MSPGIYWILAAFYACYFGVIGIWLPYWPLYLESLGLDGAAIGLLFALSQGIKVLAPPLWGGMADKGDRRHVLILTSFATWAGFCLFFLGTSFPFLVTVTLIYSFIHAGPLSLAETTTMEQVVRHGGDYGRIRVWGSLGFIAASMALGPITDRWGVTPVLWSIALLLLIAAGLAVKTPPPEASPPHDRHASRLRTLLSRPGVGWFFIAAMCMQFSHGAYYGFFSLHLEHNGFSRTDIGLLWSLGVASEIAVLTHARWIIQKIGVAPLLTLSTLLAALRWGITAATLWMPLLLMAQLLHAFTFGGFHVAAVRRAYDAAPPGGRATVQAWYGALSFGLGGSLGLLLSGQLFERFGAGMLYGVMALVALLGAFAAWRSHRSWPEPTPP